MQEKKRRGQNDCKQLHADFNSSSDLVLEWGSVFSAMAGKGLLVVIHLHHVKVEKENVYLLGALT